MTFPYSIEWPQFFTATCYNWMPLLGTDKCKKIITDSLQFMVRNKRVSVMAFVIMKNHIHLIWQVLPGHTQTTVQLSFMKYTAQKIKFALADSSSRMLQQCRVNKKDREYQIWKRSPLSVELYSEKVLMQKLSYIHENPVQSGLSACPKDYPFSSAFFYETGIDHFEMLTHFRG